MDASLTKRPEDDDRKISATNVDSTNESIAERRTFTIVHKSADPKTAPRPKDIIMGHKWQGRPNDCGNALFQKAVDAAIERADNQHRIAELFADGIAEFVEEYKTGEMADVVFFMDLMKDEEVCLIPKDWVAGLVRQLFCDRYDVYLHKVGRSRKTRTGKKKNSQGKEKGCIINHLELRTIFLARYPTVGELENLFWKIQEEIPSRDDLIYLVVEDPDNAEAFNLMHKEHRNSINLATGVVTIRNFKTSAVFQKDTGKTFKLSTGLMTEVNAYVVARDAEELREAQAKAEAGVEDEYNVNVRFVENHDYILSKWLFPPEFDVNTIIRLLVNIDLHKVSPYCDTKVCIDPFAAIRKTLHSLSSDDLRRCPHPQYHGGSKAFPEFDELKGDQLHSTDTSKRDYTYSLYPIMVV